MAFSRLVQDQNGHAIQALSPDVSVKVSITGSSARVALPSTCDVVRVSANGNCYIKFGDNAVVASANDMLFPVGAEIFAVPPNCTHLAVIQDGAATGSVVATRMV